MKKSILIVSAGPGLSRSLAEKFGKEGFTVALIGNDRKILDKVSAYLSERSIEVYVATADANYAGSLTHAITSLSKNVGGFDVVHYNAAVLKAKDILEESSASLTGEFTVNVANALHTFQVAHPDLKGKNGTFLMTGGGLGINPSADYGSLSIGKAGLRSLAYQLHSRLKNDNIHVGLVTIDGSIDPQSPTHNAGALAELFWELYDQRSHVEISRSASGTEYWAIE